MKTIFSIIALIALGVGTSFAQNSNNDPQMSVNNYKHANKAKKAATTDNRANLTSEEVALRSQRTNKAVKRNYVLAPANSEVATNVQGQKTKSNYKSQF
jgi:lipopolysaccharide biosynthesis regulator YciM